MMDFKQTIAETQMHLETLSGAILLLKEQDGNIAIHYQFHLIKNSNAILQDTQTSEKPLEKALKRPNSIGSNLALKKREITSVAKQDQIQLMKN